MSTTQSHSLNVLVVDDNKDIARTEALVLTMKNYSVTIANDGLTALREVQEHPPDVILLDIGLPGLDGHAVAKRIRDMNLPNAPILIAVTGRDEAEDTRRSCEVGIDMHLIKPVPPEALCLVLGRISRIRG